jgi:hypothetical protein
MVSGKGKMQLCEQQLYFPAGLIPTIQLREAGSAFAEVGGN